MSDNLASSPGPFINRDEAMDDERVVVCVCVVSRFIMILQQEMLHLHIDRYVYVPGIGIIYVRPA